MSAILHVQYILFGVEVSNKYCVFIKWKFYSILQ